MKRNTGRVSRRGFAAMDSELQHEIAKRGGRAAHRKGTAHEFTAAEARLAGQKGGHISSGNFAYNPERAVTAGRKGGQRSHGVW